MSVMWIASLFAPIAHAADADLDELLQGATPATAPAEVTAPATAPVDALGTAKPKAPAAARQGTVTLNNHLTLTGLIWTTPDAPLRLIIEDRKPITYRDVDFSLIAAVTVIVDRQAMEDDWRWLKEGSDQKIYSGKKYPLLELRYRFTLINGQSFDAPVVPAPLYLRDDTGKTHTLALYRKYKGTLDQTLNDLFYLKSLTLAPPTPEQQTHNDGKSTRLPLIQD